MDKAIIIEILRIAIPILAAGLVTLATAVLIRLKIVTKKDVVAAAEMLGEGFRRFDSVGGGPDINAVKSAITDKTNLTLPQVNKIAEIVQTETASGDSNKKKINRAARKIFRGILFGG